MILFYFFIQEYKKNKELEENKEYPFIYNYTQEYKGQIAKFKRSKSRRETFLVELSNGQKFTIYEFSFLRIGDSINKPVNSDSLYIRTQGKEYSFYIKR